MNSYKMKQNDILSPQKVLKNDKKMQKTKNQCSNRSKIGSDCDIV